VRNVRIEGYLRPRKVRSVDTVSNLDVLWPGDLDHVAIGFRKRSVSILGWISYSPSKDVTRGVARP
jgi:hypothetical protein